MSFYDEPPSYVKPGLRRAREALNAVLSAAIAVVVIVASVTVARVGAEALLGQCTPPWLAGTDPQVSVQAGATAGTVTVTAFFEIGAGQPQDVIDRYGVNGERLNGPDVRLDLSGSDPAPQAVQVSTDVDLSAG